ncbi:hypothetical protein [Listeria sp. PSOL-1]|uniref:hypothetical protein n=1 Tax=Listeria sp. PSOL-1 TaxID=1844999 RepID=UPI0013D01D95|nr:hypothetical protein [Listeria sp. PSOL-1]
MLFSIIQAPTKESTQELILALEAVQTDFVLLGDAKDTEITRQIEYFATHFREAIEQYDIHYFQKNPVFLKNTKKLFFESDQKVDMHFIDEVQLSVPTYLEREPFLIFKENYHLILVRKERLLEVCRQVDSKQSIEEVLFVLFSKSEKIVKQRILETIEELTDCPPINNQIDQTFSRYDFWSGYQKRYSAIELLNNDFSTNLLNYFIRTEIGPCFQSFIEAGETTKATDFLKSLMKKLQTFDKTIVTNLVSLGYFFVQCPVENYQLLKHDKAFMKCYLDFSDYLFSQLHFNSKQYYLRFYRQATNALYKASRARSEKPIRKCNELYFNDKRLAMY